MISFHQCTKKELEAIHILNRTMVTIFSSDDEEFKNLQLKQCDTYIDEYHSIKNLKWIT